MGVPLAILREQDERGRAGRAQIGDGQLRADEEREAAPPRLGPALHDPVEPVHVGEREGGEPQLRGARDQLLGVAGPLQEGVAGAAAQLGVARGGGHQSKNPWSQSRPSRPSR